MRSPAGLVAAAVVAAALTGACSTSGRDRTEGAAPAAARPPGASAAAVTVKLFMFDPDPMPVAAGTTVTWTNQDQIRHTVTAGTRTYDDQGLTRDVSPTGEFDLPLDGQGSTAEFTFTEPGTVAYLCTVHPGMDAEVVVS